MDNKTWDNIADYIYNISIKTIDNRKVVMDIAIEIPQ